MTTYKRGDVVLVAFPFTDLTSVKVRPALVVSSESFHSSGDDFILAGITSQVPVKRPSTDILLNPDEQKYAGLPKVSIVRLGKIVTLERSLIKKRIGNLPDSTMERLTSVLHGIFSSSYGPLLSEPHAAYGSARAKVVKARNKPKGRK